MSKKKKVHEPFVMLTKSLIQSFENDELSPTAWVVYIKLKSKIRSSIGNNIILTYREMNHIMAPATYSKTIKELCKKNYLEKIEQGGLRMGRNLKQAANIYRILKGL